MTSSDKTSITRLMTEVCCEAQLCRFMKKTTRDSGERSKTTTEEILGETQTTMSTRLCVFNTPPFRPKRGKSSFNSEWECVRLVDRLVSQGRFKTQSFHIMFYGAVRAAHDACSWVSSCFPPLTRCYEAEHRGVNSQLRANQQQSWGGFLFIPFILWRQKNMHWWPTAVSSTENQCCSFPWSEIYGHHCKNK